MLFGGIGPNGLVDIKEMVYSTAYRRFKADIWAVKKAQQHKLEFADIQNASTDVPNNDG